MSKKKKKKKKKVKSAAPKEKPPETSGSEEPASPGRRRKRLLVGAGVFVAVVVSFLFIASFLPGYDDPREKQRRCEKRLRRVSTAALLWSRSHGGALPGSLDAMREGGFLPGEASLYSCPATGKPYVLHADVRRGMPGSTVYFSCPEGASHRVDQREMGHKVVHVVNYLGADLCLHYDALQEMGTPEEGARAVRARFEKRVRDQRKTLVVVGRVKAGDEKARIDLVQEASQLYCRARALAVWGMGVSGDPWFRGFLHTRLQPERGLHDEFTLACAVALLRLGDSSAVPDLIDLFEGANHSHREKARDALIEVFAQADPPPPRFRSYAPASFRKEEADAWRAWWKARAVKQADGKR